jgi:periplasmic divalent cation tolerance protein
MLVEKIDSRAKGIVFIYTTCKDKEEARSIGLSAIEEHLAACADFWIIDSVYPWRGVIEEVSQCMLMLTTEKDISEKLIKFIEGIHSYTVPVIAECDTQITSPSYKLWVEKTLEGDKDFLSEEEEMHKEKNEEEQGYHPGHLK